MSEGKFLEFKEQIDEYVLKESDAPESLGPWHEVDSCILEVNFFG